MQAFINASQVNNPTGLWLIYGDEPLIASWLMDTWRVNWQKNNVDRQRLDLKSAKTWLDALSAFDHMGLFSNQTVVEVHGNHKADKKGLTAIQAFCENPNDDCLIAIMPNLNYKDKKTVFYKQCAKLGTVIDTTINHEKERQQLLTLKATEFGIQLDTQAWQLLLEQTQNNLLAAYQALWRVSDLVIGQNLDNQSSLVHINTETLKPALVSQSRYNPYDLVAHILQGDVPKVVEILAYLKQSGEAPSLILWSLAKEARLLIQLKMGAQPQDIGIWRNKTALYRNACHHVDYHTCQQWTTWLHDIDTSIKGLNSTPVWESIHQLALSMAGKDLFISKSSLNQPYQ